MSRCDDVHARLREHRAVLASGEIRRDLSGGIVRLRVTAGDSWRTVLAPHPELGAVALPVAMRAGALVLVRTWVDDLPDEARAITTLFPADAAAAALTLPEGREWAALIDEFGVVLSTGAGERALALMQRARSAGGQVAVSTQSVVDFAAATGNAALLDALADNFAAGVFHLQSSPESRDWLARSIGTREVNVVQIVRPSGGGELHAQCAHEDRERAFPRRAANVRQPISGNLRAAARRSSARCMRPDTRV